MDLKTQDLCNSSSHKEQLIRKICLPVAGVEVCYHLYERDAHFLIEISLGADCCRSDVGKSFSRAAYLYELLVQGEVTPCTMQDILEDCAIAQDSTNSFC